jgi:hypothetical protein
MMPVDKMKLFKLTLNDCKFLKVDVQTSENILSQHTKSTKCTISSCHVTESTEFFVFKTKQLLFKINTSVPEK